MIGCFYDHGRATKTDLLAITECSSRLALSAFARANLRLVQNRPLSRRRQRTAGRAADCGWLHRSATLREGVEGVGIDPVLGPSASRSPRHCGLAGDRSESRRGFWLGRLVGNWRPPARSLADWASERPASESQASSARSWGRWPGSPSGSAPWRFRAGAWIVGATDWPEASGAAGWIGGATEALRAGRIGPTRRLPENGGPILRRQSINRQRCEVAGGCRRGVGIDILIPGVKLSRPQTSQRLAATPVLDVGSAVLHGFSSLKLH